MSTSTTSSPPHSRRRTLSSLSSLFKRNGSTTTRQTRWGSTLYIPQVMEGINIREVSPPMVAPESDGFGWRMMMTITSIALMLIALFGGAFGMYGIFSIQLSYAVLALVPFVLHPILHADYRILQFRWRDPTLWGRFVLRFIASLTLATVLNFDARTTTIVMMFVFACMGDVIDAFPPSLGARQKLLACHILGGMWVAALVISLYCELLPGSRQLYIYFGDAQQFDINLKRFSADLFLVEFGLIVVDFAKLWNTHPAAMIHVHKAVAVSVRSRFPSMSNITPTSSSGAATVPTAVVPSIVVSADV